MQHQGAAAYQQMAKRTVNPRDLEANLLSRAAANMQRIRENWDSAQAELPEALKFNRKLWNVFVSSVTKEDHPLPAPVRQNIANLGLFVLKHTVTLEARPEPKSLDVLISINREIAAGLRMAA